MIVEGGAEAKADRGEDDRPDDPLPLAFEAEEGAQREIRPRRAAGVGRLGDHILVAKQRIAGDAERIHRRLDAAAPARRIGVDLRARRLVEQRIGEPRPPRVGLFEHAALGLQLQPCGVEPLERLARRNIGIAGGVARLDGEGRRSYRETRVKRLRQRRRGMAVEIGGVDPHGRDGAEERARTRIRGGGAKALDGRDELVQRDAFAASGGTKEADGERRLGPAVARELGQQLERRIDSERAGGERGGVVAGVGGENRRRGCAALRGGRRRRGRPGQRVLRRPRLRGPLRGRRLRRLSPRAGNDRSKVPQSDVWQGANPKIVCSARLAVDPGGRL